MRYSLILLVILPVALAHAQDESSTFKGQFDLGFGAGIDYGGFGVRGTYLPVSQLGVFVGAGYNLNSLGTNVGAQWLIPANRNYFFFTGMYGYNTVLIVEGPVSDKATYYGFSAGAGFQLVNRKGSKHWNFEVLVPFRNSNFQQDTDALRLMGAQITDPLPVSISIGYHIRF